MNEDALEYVDAHCHVDLYESPEAILQLTNERKVHTIAVTNAPFVFEFTRKLAEGSRFLHAAVGMHPELVEAHGERAEEIRPLISQAKFVGEVGLDYVTPNEGQRERQRKVFGLILEECALNKGKVITIHARRSAGDVIDMIGRSFPGTIILHWFSGSKKELRRAVDFGFYFSVNHAMCNSRSGKSLVEAIPKDRLLTETDGPFTRESGGPARPDYVTKTCDLVGRAWSVSAAEAARVIRDNFGVATGIH